MFIFVIFRKVRPNFIEQIHNNKSHSSDWKSSQLIGQTLAFKSHLMWVFFNDWLYAKLEILPKIFWVQRQTCERQASHADRLMKAVDGPPTQTER